MAEKKEITVEQLIHHPFVSKAFKYGMEITQHIGTGMILRKGPKWKKEPDEHEFYILEVCNRLAQLLTWCQQLSDNVLYLTTFSPTPRMKRHGITRHGHLLYTVENYIIRTLSIYDRVLLLVDSVFHICNPPENCTHDAIINNVHVKMTHLPSTLKSLKKILRKFQFQRNTIIHHESFQDDDLRRLEAYTILHQDMIKEDKHDFESLGFLPEEIRVMVKHIVREKTGDFSNFNSKIYEAIFNIFEKLEPIYAKNEARLRLWCGNKAPIM